MSDAEYRRRIVSLILAAQLTCAPVAQAAELLDRTTGTDPPSPNTTYDVTEDTTVTPVESPSPSETASPRPPPIIGGSTPTPVVSPSPTGKEEGERPSEKPEAEPTATPKTEPAATPEVTPTATPEAEFTATPEAEPTATPEVTPEVTPEAEPTAMPEITPEVMPEFAPTATPTATPEVMPEFKPILPSTGNQAPLFTMLGSPAVEEPLPVADGFPAKLSINSYADYGLYPYAAPQGSKDDIYFEAPYIIENSSAASKDKVGSYNVRLGAPGTGQYSEDKPVNFSSWTSASKVEAVRIPDREFAGWYVHLEGGTDGEGIVAWSDVEKDAIQPSYFELVKDSTGAFATTFGEIYAANQDFYRLDSKGNFTLRLIARWALSSNADALESVTSIKRTQDEESWEIDEEPTNLNTNLTDTNGKLLDMWDEESKFGDSAQTTSFDAEIKEYWAFVNTNTTMASLNFLTAEPFRYLGATDEEKNTGGGVTVTVNGEPVDVKQKYLNIGTTSYEADGKYLSVNSIDNPASALWTATAENLLEAGEVPTTVDPNGAYNKVEVTITPPNGDAAKANTYTFWIQRAKTPEIKLEQGNTPAGLNQENAFSYAFDFDADDTAVVVYTNDSFKLPSVTYVNSRGQELVNIPPQQPLELVVQVGLEVDSRAAGESENLLGMSYEWITEEKATTSVTLTADSNGVWAIPQNVLPGKYPLTYKYKDPVSKLEAEDRIRWVIVLPRPGDADLDGVVTPADGWALQQVLDAVGTDTKKWTDLQKLYFYRVADVANENGTLLVSASGGPNGIVDEHDVYALYGGYVSSETMKYYGLFYQPLEGGKKNEVASSTGNTGEGNKGTLYLDYLGKGAENPLMSTTQYVPVKSEDNPVETGDVVWVGVRLDDRTALSSNLYSMSLTLLYDSRYLLPAYQDGEGNWQQVDITKPVEDTILGAWKRSLAQANQSTVWKDVTFAYAVPGDNYQQYDRKVPLSNEEKEHKEHLRELKVSYRSEIHGYAVNEENLLLVVPMLLHKQPPMADRLSALDLSLGSGNFSVKTHDTQAAAASQQVTMAWDGAGWLVDDENTNLSKLLNFDRAADTSATTLYLLDDPSNYTDLFAAQDKSNWLYYGAPVPDNSYSFQGVNGALVGTLPLGLSYDFRRGKILGTPLAAGEFTFLAGGVGYRITVHKQTLLLTPQPTEKYYGEENPTLTFRYDPAKIPGIDQPVGVNNPNSAFACTGDGTELTYLTGYVDPVEIHTTAETKSNVGKYSISLSGGSNQNYEFVFGADAELTIHQRPIYVNAITKNPIETVRVDAQILSFHEEGSFTDGDFTAEKADLVNSGSLNLPLNGNAVVDGDDIVISYTASFQPDPNATEGNKFALSRPREDRAMTVTNFALVTGRGQNANYMLYRTDAALVGTGAVMDRAVESIRFGGNASANGLATMEYTYGQTVAFNDLKLILSYEADDGQTQKVETLTYTRPETLSDRGIHVVLLNHPEDDPTVAANVTAIASGDTMTYDMHHGKYFCAYMETGLGDEAKTVKVVSEDTIQVHQKQLTLTLQQGQAYYGEDPNAAVNLPTFTYNRDELAPEEKAKLAARNIPTTGTGRAEELAQILTGYTAPTVEVWTAVPTVVGRTMLEAGVDRWDKYFAILSGAQANNYSFIYTQYEISEGLKEEYGTSWYAVLPRPVVVDRLTMEPSSGTDGTYFLYDDTKSYTLKEMYYASGETRVPTARADGTGANTFALTLPGTSYFPTGGSSSGTATTLTGSLTGSAIFSGDASGLQVTYQATYVTDGTTTNGQWFQLADGNAQETRTVKISGLTLCGEKAKNYVLVYAANDAAMNRAPTNKDATGLVKLRAIKDMTILRDPDQMQYTYGDRLDLTGMTLQLTYETEGDNVTLDHTVTNVPFQNLVINGKQTSNFEQLSFALNWEQRSGEEGYAPLQTVRQGDYPTVAEHNGRLLVLTGRRHPSHVEVSGTTAAEVIVQKKNLTLTVTDQIRCYGEENSPYQATFLRSDLAAPDQGKVSGTQANVEISELANLTQGLDSKYFDGYSAPTFNTNVTARTGVGVWDLVLRSNGSMDNYSFTTKKGTITIEQRPIYVTAVAGTSASNPIYSIYHDDPQVKFTTILKDTGSIHVATNSVPTETTGSPIVAADTGKVEFTVSLQYKPVGSRPAFAPTEQVKDCPVDITGVELSTEGTSANYTIRSRSSNMTATAQLDNRPISKVEVKTSPKLNYLYGEKLDLSEMMLKITYEGGGTEEKLAVREGRVSYYYSDIKDTISTHEVNIRGDHLTIAKDENGFAHQGKYLVGKASHAGKDTIFSVNDPIRITPLDLTYTLTANDKVYDGTTRTTGTVTLTNLYGNDKVTASAQFDFLDANVKYRTDGYTLNPGDEYWTMFQAAPLRDSANWHEEQEVVAMPVLLSNIRLDGADKDNYTIALTEDSLDQAQKGSLDPNRNPVAQDYSIGLTDNLSSADRSTVPFAAITKADRVPTQAPAQVLVDDRTNVVKVDYNEQTAYQTIVTTSQNRNGVADDYAGEIHFEYVLELEQTDGMIRQWAGLDGDDSAQDGRFFGGEAVPPKTPVCIEGEGSGYVPDTEDFPSTEDMAEENFNYQGQIYRWAEEDAGFRLNTAAYPGGIYRPGYSLYETDRQPLPRAATAWVGVRVAATHNYNASSFIYSVPGETQLLRAQNAAAVADPVTQQRIDELKYYGEEEKWPNGEEVDTFTPEAYAAVNTYAQRLDLISVEEQDSAAESGSGSDRERYNVYTLETVQFTDLMDYPEKQYMDGVVNGAGTANYDGYYWDEKHSAELDFEGRDTDSPLDLRTPLVVTIEVKVGNETREEIVTVNVDNTAEIYVNLSSDSSLILEHSVEIDPSEIIACLGDEPLQLSAKVQPVTATFKSVTWSTSDPSVATVNRKGLVTFVGVGECVITARTRNGETATATVVVKLPEEPVETMGHFNLSYQGAYLWTNELGRVDPDRGLTRGELAQLFAQFCIAQEDAKVYEISFPDLEGKDYTVSVELLAALGIVNGTGTGYQGDLLATRAEAVTMLARMLCLDVSFVEDGDYAFGDSRPEDTWAWAYIEAMADAKLTNGVGESLFAPDRKITYAEVAVLLDRILERTHPNGEGVVLPDGMEADHWAYQSFVKGLNQAPVSENVSQ